MAEQEPEKTGEKDTPAGGRIPIPGLYRNWISWAGTAIALVVLANILFLLLLDLFGVKTNPYVGIIAYMILPAVMILGLLLIPIGMVIERWRRRKLLPGQYPPYPRIDLNSPRQRSAFVFFLTGGLFFLFLSALGSYRAYEYTETTQFCGQLCHVVMNPEFTAYQASPHARVPCVSCHVGPGAGWYVRSKLSGARQLYAAAFNKFPRPIPTPVHNLRPARETCEQCHWPERFYGGQLKVITHYANDEKNTPLQVRLLIKTGGGSPTTGIVAGIHWHMNIANEVTYVATDEQRQTIPWVRIKDRQGRVTEYTAKDAKLTPAQLAAADKRTMDCVDCHNRPSHVYVPPDRSVEEAMFAQHIDVTLPAIKQNAVEVLSQAYTSTPEALEKIATTLDRTYLTKYPEAYKQKQESLRQAITEVQRIFQTTIFPEMKVDWRTHPNNIGHMYFAGCFRCHDGNHVSPEGRVISKDCESCHTFVSEQAGGTPSSAISGVQFKHPVDIGDMKDVSCTDCHGGTQ
ncbi:MAG: NapC/NirT family cytochrome c [Candidatus Koribacter versatilis]|uniref:NapC/NirT family cytochrome c n=1 Tax=Candidatus Korobacter versatilis TaxID=658062 RepID=A0A932A778_9BACT|nr:NapC/NirT family cytochrome c [Candidatus Koribacter versatilis]